MTSSLTPDVSSAVALEMGRIRALTEACRFAEALAAAEVLACQAPENPDVLYLIATNQRCLNRFSEALASLEHLEVYQPRLSRLHQERGYCYVALRDVRRAIDAFERAVSINPALPGSWTLLERLYRMTGDLQKAESAAGHVHTLEQLPPEVIRAGSLFSEGELNLAASILRGYLADGSRHVEALRLLGRIEHRRRALESAERLLQEALQIAPHYVAARVDYIRVLIDRQQYARAREELDPLRQLAPTNSDYLLLYTTACVGLGEHEEAIVLYRRLLDWKPDSPDLLVALAHSLKTVGRAPEALQSYRAAAALRPGFGDAWWSLANLKTYRFSTQEIASMRAEEVSPSANPVDRYHLCFALGKALEDRGEYADSWLYYQRGNGLKRAESHYRPEITETNTRLQIEMLTAGFFAARAGFGVMDPAPIFIVGLPRSGSTLMEQILASHSEIEGTHELADIPRMAEDLPYPDALVNLTPEDFRTLGARYLSDTRPYRKSKPFFIDKMPNNFRHIGLIHLMLPQARIIDIRREPMACCLSNLQQLFASGQAFSYSMVDIARYYRNYLELMRHWDQVLPGRVLRVHYEDLIEDLEGTTRRILDFCGLPFQHACLEFHRTQRSVHTPSSEQVRQPLFRDGLQKWQNYEPWLGPLADALSDARSHYRE